MTAAATLSDDHAWRLAMAGAAVLKDRVWLVEAREDTSTMVAQYEWINVQVYDPKSRAFAALPRAGEVRQGADMDYSAYAHETRRALTLWAAIARCSGFSARENPSFWLRVLREVTPSSHGRVSEVPLFFDTPDGVFPRFRLTFQPRDCYDDDLHETTEATDWMEEFCGAFFANEATDECEDILETSFRELAQQSAVSQSRQHATPLQVVFRIPVKRIHGPLGSSLEQHREFLNTSQRLSSQLTVQGAATIAANPGFSLHLVECIAILRGSICPSEFAAVAHHFGQRSTIHVSGLCIDLGDEDALDAFATAVKDTAITTLTVNVSRSTVASIAALCDLLQHCSLIRSLRLFNAFTGIESEEQWKHLGRVIALSQVKELIMERTHLENSDARALRLELTSTPSTLRSLTIKPVTTAGVSKAAYLDFVKTAGGSLHQIDISTLCLEVADVDAILESCPNLESLCLGLITSLTNSRLVEMLGQRACSLSALALSCSNEGVRALSSVLSKRPADVALVGDHLKELSLTLDTLEPETSNAVLHMLDTNESLRYLHLKRRSHDETPLDARFAEHHRHQLVRKLPVANIAAFLSVSSHGATTSAMDRLDMGVVSEIVGFAGHAVERCVHCS